MNRERVLELIREILTEVEGKMEPASGVAEVQPSALGAAESMARKISRRVYDEIRTADDPQFDDLPANVQLLMEEFARRVNGEIVEKIAGAVKAAYSKFTDTVVADILKLKE